MRAFLYRVIGAGLAATTMLLSGCGGGGAVTPTEPVSRLEVTPTAVLFNGTGQQQALKVRAFGASGAEIINAPIAFASSQPSQVSVDSAGTVTAVGAVGSAQITVLSGTVSAQPILAIAAETYPGTILVPDEQFSTAPQLVAGAAAGLGGQFVVGIRGIASPPTGTIILASGSAPVAGKVVSVSAADNGSIAVTLEVVPIAELFRNLSVSQTFTPAQVAQLTVFALDDAQTQGTSQLTRPLNAGRSKKLKCVPTFDAALIQEDLTPSVDQNLAAAIDFGVRDSVSKAMLIEFKGTVMASVAGTVTVGSVKGELKCKLPILNIPLPVTGAFSAIFSPMLDLGIGFSLEVDVSTNLSVGLNANYSADVVWGVKRDADGRKVDINKTSVTGQVDLTPSGIKPSDRVRLSVFAGPLGGISVRTLGINSKPFVEVSAGVDLSSSWAGVYDAAHDSTFTNEDKLSTKLTMSNGEGLDQLLGLTGHIRVVDLDFSAEETFILGTSPKVDSVRLNQNSYKTGDALTFTLSLDPTTIRFLGFYNVQEVRIYALDSTAASATLVASAAAVDGQSNFKIPWVAHASGSVGTIDNPRFFAFVVPHLLATPRSILPAELGPVAGPSVAVRPAQTVLQTNTNAQFDASVAGNKTNDGIQWSASGGTISAQGAYTAGSAAGNFEVRALRTATGEVAISQVTVQAESSGFTISGVVADELGKAVGGAKVTLTSDGITYSAISGDAGFYNLHITDAQASKLPPGFVVNASEPKTHNPSSKTLTAADSRFVRADFVLLTVSGNPGLLSIELVPDVHHIGDNNFSGSANSQFQFPNAEGTTFARSFNVTSTQKAFSTAKIVLNAKGVECSDEIYVNSTRITALGLSDIAGAFSRYEIELPLSVLSAGPNNVFSFVATACVAGDLDDIEFSNVQIRFK